MKNYAKSVGHDYEDIVSIGFIGLINAFDKFDGEQYDVRFSTYAVPLIWGEIQKSLRASGTGVRYSTGIKDIGWSIRKNELEDLSVDEIAAQLEVSRGRVVHAQDFLKHGIPGSLDQPIRAAEGESSIADLIGEPDDATGMFVQEFLDSLTERERMVAVGLMDGNSQTDIAPTLGVGKGQIYNMRKRIAEKYLEYSGMQESIQSPVKERTLEKEVKKVAKKNKPVSITEKAVNAMKEKGMSYKAIAKEFGVTLQTLTNRRQNWELERVREQHQEGKDMKKPLEKESVTAVVTAESSADLSQVITLENEIKGLKDVVDLKDRIIHEQRNVIVQLKVERDELANRSETIGGWQEEIKDERKLLAILLEREAVRIKNLLEVG
ncbi:DNA-directed RNA polymerase specialized sigma subunit [Filibacter limicola]|uniref:RNA polymerase sigma factor SigS n=1 Tax=Sporosarcina limicola TaxID=34101 RepID=A0A927MHH4_9BACL|nr:DNA-directed RNA polymerase specialized sigma subunit [Sporosarcina limicola]